MTPSSGSVQAARSTAMRGASGLTLAKEAADSLRSARAWWRNRTSYSLRLPSDDPLYADAHAWVLGLMPQKQRRALMVRTTSGPSDDEVSDSPGAQQGPSRLVVTSYDESEQHVVVDGQKVAVVVVTPDEVKDYRKPDVLLFTCRNQAGQHAVTRHLQRLMQQRGATRRPEIRLLNTAWNSWTRRGDLPPRPVESVVLVRGQMERLIADLGAFLEQEQTYNSRAVPWHRGYLLHGPPGTGKTSVVKALAGHFGLDLWYAPLGDMKDDSGLLSLLSQVHPRSMLLLEDVDVFAATQERHPDASARLSLSGVLNALDGVATPHGLVKVMTTNTPDVLDGALLRPGRMDVVEEVGLPDDEQAGRMFAAFYGRPPRWPIAAGDRSSAAVAEVFKRHMHDPDGAASTLRARNSRSVHDPGQT